MTVALIILLFVEALIIIGSLAFERVSIAFLSFVGCLAIAHFGLDIDLLKPILADVPMAIGLFFGYLAIGAAYSVVRWYFRVKRAATKLARVSKRKEKERDKAHSEAMDYVVRLNENPEQPLPQRNLRVGGVYMEDLVQGDGHGKYELDQDGYLRAWDDSGMAISFERRDLLQKLNVSSSKVAITGWIMFWPFDSFVLFFEEPVQALYEHLTTTYQRMAKNALRKAGVGDLVDKVE